MIQKQIDQASSCSSIHKESSVSTDSKMRKQKSSCTSRTPSGHMFANNSNSQGDRSYDHKSENPLHRRSTDPKTMKVERLDAAEVRFSQYPDESYHVFGRGMAMSGTGLRNKTEAKQSEQSPKQMTDFKGSKTTAKTVHLEPIRPPC